MVSLPTSAELQASRAGPVLPGVPGDSSATPTTSMPTAKRLPAAKAPPVYYDNTAPATPRIQEKLKHVNSPNLEPGASSVRPPAISVPGKA
eukprot:10260401-Alexandrium_andersonii.AAC.1